LLILSQNFPFVFFDCMDTAKSMFQKEVELPGIIMEINDLREFDCHRLGLLAPARTKSPAWFSGRLFSFMSLFMGFLLCTFFLFSFWLNSPELS